VVSGVTSDATRRHGRSRVAVALLDTPGSLLDYGCGNGKFASSVAEQLGIPVDVCDVNPAALARAEAEPGVRAHLVSEEAPRLPMVKGQFEAVTCCDVMEHMPEAARQQSLVEIHRVLADGGALIVTVPHRGLFSFADPENFKFHLPRLHRLAYRTLKGRERYQRRYASGRFGNYSTGVQRHQHFSTDELTRILAGAGFQVETTRYFTLVYPFARIALWTAEGVHGRLGSSGRPLARLSGLLVRWCWRIYLWDADLECGRAACSIAVRARKVGREPAVSAVERARCPRT
jgi:ubiquinone/menaquinone biosynthesis C-methylase UbiE